MINPNNSTFDRRVKGEAGSTHSTPKRLTFCESTCLNH